MAAVPARAGGGKAQVVVGFVGSPPPGFQNVLLNVQAGVIATSLADISGMLNGGLLKGMPLENVSLSAEGQQLKLKGTLHKGVPLPIEMVSDVHAAPDGRIQLHMTKLRVLKLPVKGLVRSFHINLGDLIGAQGASAADVERAFTSGPASALVAVSRSIDYAYRTSGGDWRAAAGAEAVRLRDEIWSVSGW